MVCFLENILIYQLYIYIYIIKDMHRYMWRGVKSPLKTHLPKVNQLELTFWVELFLVVRFQKVPLWGLCEKINQVKSACWLAFSHGSRK